MALVSIIIPIFNAGEFLISCLESVRVQTYKDFEVIMIDDCSSDNSRIICEQYVKNDPRFFLIKHIENGGESAARNTGLKYSKNKYIVFVDADDRVLPNYLQTLLYDGYIPTGTLVHSLPINERNGIIESEVERDSYFINKLVGEESRIDFLFAGPTWSKLLENKIIKENNLTFKEDIKMNVDHTFHLEYLLFINSYKFVNQRTYFYIKRKIETLSSKQFPYEEYMKRLQHIIPLTEKVIKHFEIVNTKLIADLYSTPINSIIQGLYSIYRDKYKKNKSERLLILNELNVQYNGIIKNIFKPKNLKDKLFKSIFLIHQSNIQDFLYKLLIWVRYSLLK